MKKFEKGGGFQYIKCVGLSARQLMNLYIVHTQNKHYETLSAESWCLEFVGVHSE